MPSTTYYKKCFLWTSANEGDWKILKYLLLWLFLNIHIHIATHHYCHLILLSIVNLPLTMKKLFLVIIIVAYFLSYIFIPCHIIEEWNEATTALNIAKRNFFQLVNKEEIKFLNVLISCIYFYLSSHYVYNLMLYLSPKYNALIRMEMMQGVVHKWCLNFRGYVDLELCNSLFIIEWWKILDMLLKKFFLLIDVIFE